MLNAPIPPCRCLPVRKEKKSKKTATHRRDVTLLSVAFGMTSTARQSPSLRPQSCLSLVAPISHELSTGHTKRPLDFSSGLSGSMRSGQPACFSKYVDRCLRLLPATPREPPRPRRNCIGPHVAVNIHNAHSANFTPPKRNPPKDRTQTLLP